MPSNNFEREIKLTCEKIFPVAYNWGDTPMNPAGNFGSQSKPFDMFGCTLTGSFWTVEAKRVKPPKEITKNGTANLPIDKVRPHQIDVLENSVYDLACIAINFRGKIEGYHNIEGEYLEGKTRMGIAFLIDSNRWKKLQQRRVDLKRRSISLKWIPKDCMLERLGVRQGFESPIWWPSRLHWLHSQRYVGELSEYFREKEGYIDND